MITLVCEHCDGLNVDELAVHRHPLNSVQRGIPVTGNEPAVLRLYRCRDCGHLSNAIRERHQTPYGEERVFRA
jgi:hypothetical protein